MSSCVCGFELFSAAFLCGSLRPLRFNEFFWTKAADGIGDSSSRRYGNFGLGLAELVLDQRRAKPDAHDEPKRREESAAVQGCFVKPAFWLEIEILS